MSLMSRSPVRLALIGATFALLAACGNKGPLVMPQKPVPVEAQPVPQPPDKSTPAPAPVDTDAKPASTTDQPASSGNER
ncbi:lipoprotein [Xanthomonas populi]|uniref:Sugar transporter n=1 Tax=Xanthomonas populi TaxID=53414 RepID=A0A2S7EXB8_9XANT|nr:lipoprotein [Xanthomonas populi]PPU97792.1 sugar transporter [Xanthomonas populi]